MFILAYVAWSLWILPAVSAQSTDCPPALGYVPKAKSIGRSIFASYLLVNSGPFPVENVIVRMGLPDSAAARLKVASVFPSPKGMHRVDVDSTIYWTNVTVPAKRRRKFWLRLDAVLCQAMTLEFQFLTYLVSSNGTNYCPSGQTSPEVRSVVEFQCASDALNRIYNECHKKTSV